MTFIARGIIAPHGSNYNMVGRTTFLSEPNEGWFAWDGTHKVRHFASRREAADALEKCVGPWFLLPDPKTVEIVDSRDTGPAQPFSPTTTTYAAEFAPTQPSVLADFQPTQPGRF